MRPPVSDAHNAAMQVLLIEEDAGDATRIAETLIASRSLHVELTHVTTVPAGVAYLTAHAVDVVLLNLSAPDNPAQEIETFNALHAECRALPIIVLTKQADRTVALQVIRGGAQDYLVKGQMDSQLLSRVMQYAIERKRTERELQMANQRLRTLGSLKDEFVATVSHELRTPLTSMREGIGLLQEQALGPVNAEQEDFLKMMREDVDRLTEMITNLLDLSKIEAGKMLLTLSQVDLNQLMQQCQRTYRPLLGQRQFQIHTVDVPPMFADEHKVVQVLTNLISNAVKFTPEDGTITVASTMANGMVECAVRDSGPGMTGAQLERLFQKFQQVGTASSQRGMRGTGLGLAVCKELLELQDGWIRADSTVGTGTTVTFALPIYTAAGALNKLVIDLRDRAQQHNEPWGIIALRLLRGKTWSVQIQDAIRQQIERGDQILLYIPDTLLVFAMTDARGLGALANRLVALVQQQLDTPLRFRTTYGPVIGLVPDDRRAAPEALAHAAVQSTHTHATAERGPAARGVHA